MANLESMNKGNRTTFKPIVSDFRQIRLSSIEPQERKRIFREVLCFALIVIIFGYTLYPFILALLFPIRHSEDYGILSGIFHGLIYIENLFLSIFDHGRLVVASGQGNNYYTSYRIAKHTFLSIGILSLIYIIFQQLTYKLARAMPKTSSRMEPCIPLGEFDPTKREMRIFISSTFRDMQKIRDVIMCKIFPLMQREADERQVRLIPIDLRWGITEEESQSGKVLGICLDEIDKASPFFIGIIGGKYGWTPDHKDYGKDTLLATKSPLISQALEEGLSATELELKYGVEWRPYSDDAIIFINPLSLTQNDCQEFLQRWIMDSGAFNYKEFSEIDELERLVESYIRNLLNKYYPITEDNTSDLELRKLASLTYPLRHFYLENSNASGPIEDFLRESDKNTIIISGEKGIGKFAAALDCAYKVSDQVLAIADNKFSDSHNIGKIMAETIYNDNSIDILIFRAPADISLISQLSATAKKLKPDLKIIVISPSDSRTDYNINPDIHILSEFAHDITFYRNFIIKYLGSFGKKATEEQIDKILAAKQPLTPAILKIILNELIVFGSFELLDSKIETLCSFPDKSSLYKYLYRTAEKKYGKALIRKISEDLLKEDEVHVTKFSEKHIWHAFSSTDLRACASGFCGFDYYKDTIRFSDNDFETIAKQLYGRDSADRRTSG